MRENLGMVIVGAIAPKGSGYHISIKGVGPGADGDVKYTLEDEAASKADVLATVGELAAQVRRAMGDTVAPAASDAFTAASIEAAREYVKAQELLAAGKADAAIPVYLQAARLDPDFGRAWSGAATAARNLGRREEAEKYYSEALAKIDRMTDREKLRTRGQYYLFTNNSIKAVEENEALVQQGDGGRRARGGPTADQRSAAEQRRALCALRGKLRGRAGARQEGQRAEQDLWAGLGDAGVGRDSAGQI
jgi:tetratricopeptide (TPR) repeat protein